MYQRICLVDDLEAGNFSQKVFNTFCDSKRSETLVDLRQPKLLVTSCPPDIPQRLSCVRRAVARALKLSQWQSRNCRDMSEKTVFLLLQWMHYGALEVIVFNCDQPWTCGKLRWFECKTSPGTQPLTADSAARQGETPNLEDWLMVVWRC